MKLRALIMGIISTLCGILGCTAQTNGFKSMEVQEFSHAISDTTKSVLLLDVRTADEYADGHIGKAMNIDVLKDDFEAKATSILPKDKTIAVYCRSGKRSKKAAGILVRNGYDVIELNSGYIGWTETKEK